MKFDKMIKRENKWDKFTDTLANIIACPIRPFYKLYCYIEDKMYEHREWSDEKATKVLDKILPRVLEYVEEDNAYYYCMNWSEWGLYHNAPIGYFKWVKKFAYELHSFIANGYENKDYIKTIETDDFDIWVKFLEK